MGGRVGELEPIDFITLTQVLRDRGKLDQVGGAVIEAAGAYFAETHNRDRVRALAEQLSEAMAKEFLIDGKSVRTGITTGISVLTRSTVLAGAAVLTRAGGAAVRGD